MPSHTIDQLNEIFSEAEQLDQDIFAEQRSNILLIAGDHYTGKNSKYWNRLRESKELSSEQKVRITKNHTQKIVKTYVNNILTLSPGTGFMPKNENELQDQKAAELCESVWVDWKQRNKFSQKIREFASDFCGIGEVAAKVIFDPNLGSFRGYEGEIDPLTGQAVPVEGGKPIFTGDASVERIFGFNLLRHPDAKSMFDHNPKIIRKMVDIKEALLWLPEGKEYDQRRKWIESACKDETYKIFDTVRGGYADSKNQVLFREHYYPACPLYPMGYYFITVKNGIIFEGEIPYGIFPIVYQNWDEVQTTPRGRSIVKQLRPYQAEINRAGSKIAEHQITLGDDKILYQDGAKVTQGGILPGVRGLKYTGAVPTIIGGRTGDQYLGYMNSQIDEMYKIANVYEDSAEKNNGQMDVYAQLFKSATQRKQFVTYAGKFEEFHCEITNKVIDLLRHYLPDDVVIAAVGKPEQVNISEFKNTTPLNYEVKVVGQSEDVETKMGKQLAINQVLQYVGTNLSKEDLGKLIKNMPYGNMGQGFDDLTMKYDMANNIILALDRGQFPKPMIGQDGNYILQRLSARMSQSDFQFLAPQIQQNYQIVSQLHEKAEADKLAAIKAAESEFIPTGGYMVAADFYVTDPARPGRTTRAKIPYESLAWLLKQLEAQGTSLEALGQLQQGVQAQIAQQLVSDQGQSNQSGSSFHTDLEGVPAIKH